MIPRIIAIAGPLKTSVFELRDDEVTIGRELHNNLVINDLSVSREHCLLRREDEGYRLSDCDSHNKTFINDKLTKERLLEHGDRIRIGSSLFIFLVNNTEAFAGLNKVQLEDSALITKTAIKLRLEDALYLVARDLSVLMEISRTINSLRGLEALEERLLEQIFEVVPAERGAILLLEEGSCEEFDAMFGRERDARPSQTVRVSRTITHKTIQERVAVLSNDVVESAEFGKVQSLISSRIQSLLCVPLVLFDRVLGVIYLDSKNAGVCFDRGHLLLLTAIANMAAGVLSNVRHIESLEDENRRLRAAINVEHNMVGKSMRMMEVYKSIERVSPTEITVLIRGESGTGKELVARSIHRNSPRAHKPFVGINCAAIAEGLLESELFGHERGSFTNAYTRSRGKLEMADGGTLFLDEVGEMSYAGQIKLLRVLQEREFVRVGGTEAVKVDIRLVAATNKNLEEAIKQGTFRQDLYFRLNVFPIIMPPLRERPDDILLLAKFFIDKHAARSNRRTVGISPEARSRLMNYHWPGNVRELENVIESAIVLCSGEQILPEDLPRSLLMGEKKEAASSFMKYYEAVQEAKRRIVLNAFEWADGEHAEAARILGIHPNNLHRLMRTLNLRVR